MKNSLVHQSLEERRQMILHGGVLKTLLFLSVPTLLMGMVQALVPIADSFFLNQTSGYAVAAAVGFVVPIISILNGTSTGLGVSGMAMIGNANGRGDRAEVKRISTQLMAFGFLLGIAVAPLSFVSGLIIAKFINPEIAHEVYVYMGLYSFVMPFLFVAAIFNAIKNAVGQPEATLYRITLFLVLKISFNYLYLNIFGLGTVGSVMSSLSSYSCIGAWMYYDLFIKKSELQLSLKGFSFDKEVIGEILRLGIPSMLNYMTVNLGFVLINLEVQKYGGSILNAQTIASNLSAICFLIPSSLGTTVTTIVSMNMGLGEEKRAKKSFHTACIVSVVMSIIIIAIFIPTAKPLVKFFKPGENMMKMTEEAIEIYTLAIIGFSIYMVAQGAFIGLGKTKIPVFTGVLRIWLLRYLFILIFEKSMGVYSVFWGNLFSNTVAGTICLLMALNISWKTNVRLGYQDRD